MKKLAARLGDITPSATLAINARAKELVSQGVDVITFAVGEPDFDTPEIAKQAGKDAIDANFTRYTPASGTLELKQAICDRYREKGFSYTPKNVIITCGGKHALYNAMQTLLDPGDEVLLPAPYWVSFPEMVKLAGGVPVTVQTDKNFQFTASDLEKKITDRTKLIIINSPSNPTGAILERSELEKIAKLAIDRDLYLISDEVYEHFTYDGEHASVASFGDEVRERTLIIKAVSKSYAMTGWRIGYATGPESIIAGMSGLQSHMTSGPTSIAQKAALAALKGDDSSVREMVRAFKERRDYLITRLNGIDGIECSTPGGAFYAFPDVSRLYGGRIKNSVDLCTYLLEEAHIALVPGSAFGSDDHVRMSYAASMDDIKEGLNRLEKGIQNLKKAVVNG